MATAKRNGHKTGLLLVAVCWSIALLALVCAVATHLHSPAEPPSAAPASAELLRIALAVCAISSLLGLALTACFVVDNLAAIRAGDVSMVNDLRRLLSSQTNTQALLTQISESLLLSDAIKSVAFRDKDRMVLEDAIQQDMRMEKWDSAALLIEEMASRFGSKQQAQELRDKLEHLRNATIEEKNNDAIKHIESLWLIHHYDEAEREVTALHRLYPDNPRIQALLGQTEQRRQGDKKELLARWDRAVQNNDVDQGIELLKLLDNYLTPTEGAALKESARGVIQAKLHNLGVKFSMYVTDKRWDQALKVGREIIAEFPNSRMAQEVRERLSVLEQRAQ